MIKAAQRKLSTCLTWARNVTPTPTNQEATAGELNVPHGPQTLSWWGPGQGHPAAHPPGHSEVPTAAPGLGVVVPLVCDEGSEATRVW